MGTGYIKLQRAVNKWKKAHIGKWWVKTKFVYTFIIASIILTIVWNLKLLMTGDKMVIDTLINID